MMARVDDTVSVRLSTSLRPAVFPVLNFLWLQRYEFDQGVLTVGGTGADDLPPLWADPHQLHQAVVDLVANAHQAMRETAPPRRLTLTTRFDPSSARVSLEVADTGPGIPPDIQAQLFAPFFTTKPLGVGTWLGQPLCQGSIEGHRGTIRLASPAGPGAVFRIELPVEAGPVTAPETRGAEALPALSGKVILIVDDEPEIAEILAEMLALHGDRVETARTGPLPLRSSGSGPMT